MSLAAARSRRECKLARALAFQKRGGREGWRVDSRLCCPRLGYYKRNNTKEKIVEVFHVWWDPRVYAEILRAKGTIVGFHVSDWPVPLPGILVLRHGDLLCRIAGVSFGGRSRSSGWSILRTSSLRPAQFRMLLSQCRILRSGSVEMSG